jgi:hypothetical protein
VQLEHPALSALLQQRLSSIDVSAAISSCAAARGLYLRRLLHCALEQVRDLVVKALPDGSLDLELRLQTGVVRAATLDGYLASRVQKVMDDMSTGLSTERALLKRAWFDVSAIAHVRLEQQGAEAKLLRPVSVAEMASVDLEITGLADLFRTFNASWAGDGAFVALAEAVDGTILAQTSDNGVVPSLPWPASNLIELLRLFASFFHGWPETHLF